MTWFLDHPDILQPGPPPRTEKSDWQLNRLYAISAAARVKLQLFGLADVLETVTELLPVAAQAEAIAYTINETPIQWVADTAALKELEFGQAFLSPVPEIALHIVMLGRPLPMVVPLDDSAGCQLTRSSLLYFVKPDAIANAEPDSEACERVVLFRPVNTEGGHAGSPVIIGMPELLALKHLQAC